MNPTTEINKILTELEKQVKNIQELNTIKINVPDDYIDDNGKRKLKSDNLKNVKLADYFCSKTTEIRTYITLNILKTMNNNRKLQTFLLGQYKKHNKEIEKLTKP